MLLSRSSNRLVVLCSILSLLLNVSARHLELLSIDNEGVLSLLDEPPKVETKASTKEGAKCMDVNIPNLEEEDNGDYKIL